MRDEHFYTDENYPRAGRRNRWYRHLLTRPRFRQISKIGIVRPHTKILDIGCGEGNLVRLLESEGALAYGIDINFDLVRAAQHPRIVLGRADVLPFADGTFDVCVSSHLIEHLDRPGVFLRETARVVRDRGHVILIYPWELVRGITTVPDIIFAGRLPRPSLLRRIHRQIVNPDKLRMFARGTGLRHLRSWMFLGLPHVSLQYVSVLAKSRKAQRAAA
jgi:2-polyprenyl-3-methyl-5-hydroxy-6-metoxy-1,4-benzoquinol methylase